MKYNFVIAISSIVTAQAASFGGEWFGMREYLGRLLVNPGTTQSVEGLRLLELSPQIKNWYNEDQTLQLKRDGINFIDITDYADRYEAFEKTNAVSATTKKTEFPSKITHYKEAHDYLKSISQDNLISTLTNFSSFHTRYAKSENGLESCIWLKDEVEKIASKSKIDIDVRFIDHDWIQKSVIATIPGKKNPDHLVVVGAHQDSINLLMPSVLPAPGADDDGSGSMTILETFRVLVEGGFVPDNTVEFHWYSAEELGLWGSQAIFTDYADKGVDVKAMLQQDMTGYSSKTISHDGSDSLGLITDFVDDNLTNFIRLVVNEYCEIPYVETSCGYACSDHASASKAGYPSAFVIESEFKKSDPYIHSILDTVDRLDFAHMEQHVRLTLGYAYELAFHQF